MTSPSLFPLYDLSDIVDKDLKNKASAEEIAFLHSNLSLWRNELIRIKRKVEMSLTSCNVRSFSIYKERQSGLITHKDYINQLENERIKKCNISHFLFQIENKLCTLKSVSNV